MKKLCVKAAVAVLCFINVFFRPLKLKDRVVIISRQSDEPTLDIRLLSDRLKERGVETAVLCKKISGISYGFHILKQMFHLATSRVVVVDSYCIPVSVLPKKKGQKVIQTWHSLAAIKKFGWQSAGNVDGRSKEVSEIMKMHAGYDYFLAPCAKTAEHFAQAYRTAADKEVRIGLPRLDFIKIQEPEMKEKIEAAYPQMREKCNVLYVPTFRRHAGLALEKLVEGFDFTSFNLIIKKHFLDTGDYTWAEEAGAIVDTKFGSLDWMKISDKIVTDYSAISIEAASILKELYIYQPDVESYGANNGLNVDMHEEAIRAYVCDTEEELFAALQKPYDKNDILAFRDKFLDVDLNDCTGQLCDLIESLLHETTGESNG